MFIYRESWHNIVLLYDLMWLAWNNHLFSCLLCSSSTFSQWVSWRGVKYCLMISSITVRSFSVSGRIAASMFLSTVVRSHIDTRVVVTFSVCVCVCVCVVCACVCMCACGHVSEWVYVSQHLWKRRPLPNIWKSSWLTWRMSEAVTSDPLYRSYGLNT